MSGPVQPGGASCPGWQSRQRCCRNWSLRDFDAGDQRWLASRARAATQTNQELPDIVDVLLEDLIKHRYALPGFTILLRVACAARQRANAAIFECTFKALAPREVASLDCLFKTSHDKSDGERRRRDFKQPTTREVASFLNHVRWLAEPVQRGRNQTG